MRQRQLHLWDYADQRKQELIRQRLSTADQFALWVKQMNERQQGDLSEIAANGVITLIYITCILLDRQIAAQADTFQREGGFTERLYRVRADFRKQ